MKVTIHPLSDAEWQAKIAGFQDATFEQSIGYGRPAAARISGQLILIAVEDGDKTLALAAARVRKVPGFRRGILWIPSGPILLPVNGQAPDDQATSLILNALRDHFVAKQGHILRFRLAGIARRDPNSFKAIAATAGFTATTRAQNYHSLAMDLTQGTETLMANLAGKWRTDLRFAQKSGLTLEQGAGFDMMRRFMALFDTVQKAKGFQPDIPPQFHFDLATPGKATDYTVDILIAQKDGQDVAGIVLGTTGRCTTYLFGATADHGRPLRAGYFLQWEGIALARNRGSLWYDLGGVDAVANPDVARFKERMGGLTLNSTAFEARPSGVFPYVINILEILRARLRKTRI